MKETRVTSRYAKSLLLLAVERGEMETVFADMKVVATTCEGSRDLTVLLKSPLVKTDKKMTILKMIFEGQLSELSNNFINILTRKKRESLLEGVAESFMDQYRTYSNITSVAVTSAAELSEAQKQKVIALLPKGVITEKIEITETIDPSLIGGFIVRVGDVQIDHSVARKLNDLRGEFDDNLYVA